MPLFFPNHYSQLREALWAFLVYKPAGASNVLEKLSANSLAVSYNPCRLIVLKRKNKVL
jgi:hypothetical protein